MPGTPKAIQGERDWKELEKLGITARVNPKDCNLWTSPLHQVPKPDGTLRSCGDFRVLNDKTLLDSYPLPNLRHFTAKLKGSKVFFKNRLNKSLSSDTAGRSLTKESDSVNTLGGLAV